MFNDEMQCEPYVLHYNYTTRLAHVMVRDIGVPDMTGTITYLTRLFPDVVDIEVVNQRANAMRYLLRADGRWVTARVPETSARLDATTPLDEVPTWSPLPA